MLSLHHTFRFLPARQLRLRSTSYEVLPETRLCFVKSSIPTLRPASLQTCHVFRGTPNGSRPHSLELFIPWPRKTRSGSARKIACLRPLPRRQWYPVILILILDLPIGLSSSLGHRRGFLLDTFAPFNPPELFLSLLRTLRQVGTPGHMSIVLDLT